MDALGDGFDTMVVLEGPGGIFVAENDDFGGTRNSRIDTALPEDGLYRIIPKAWSGNGPYRLTVETRDLPTLQAGTPAFGGTGSQELWLFAGTAGQIVSLDMTTDRPELGPTMTLARVGDTSWSPSSAFVSSDVGMRIDPLVLPADDLYLVTAGLYSSGSFSVTLNSLESRPLVFDQAELFDDPAVWALDAAPGQLVHITLDAVGGSGLDPVVRLLKPDGQEIAWDDDAGVGRNSALTLVLPDSPGYLVQADRYGGSGAFSLSVATLEPEPLPVDGSSATVLPNHAWTVNGEAGQVLTIDIVDTGADGVGYLQLVTSDGAVLAYSGGSSQLAAILPQNGEYLLLPQSVADSGEDTLTARLTDAASASNLDGVAAQTLYQLALNNAIDQALALYAWGTTGRNVVFTADALNALCWHGAVYGALHGGADRVTTVCEELVDTADPTDPYYLTLRHDIRGVARALTGHIDGAIEDFQYYIDNSGDRASQRQEWVTRLRAGEPAADVFDEATLRELLLQ